MIPRNGASDLGLGRPSATRAISFAYSAPVPDKFSAFFRDWNPAYIRRRPVRPNPHGHPAAALAWAALVSVTGLPYKPPP